MCQLPKQTAVVLKFASYLMGFKAYSCTMEHGFLFALVGDTYVGYYFIYYQDSHCGEEFFKEVLRQVLRFLLYNTQCLCLTRRDACTHGVLRGQLRFPSLGTASTLCYPIK